MASNLCFYFQVHQPYRLRDLRASEIGDAGLTYFDEEKNRQIFRKVAEKCYLPSNRLMLELLNEHKDFAVSYSLSGVFLDQCEEYGQDVLDSFRALAKTGRVEFLAETSHHSLAAIRSLPEFLAQVESHMRRIKTHFGITPQVFRNTELIFTNEIAQLARLMGFKGIMAEGADHVLRGRNPNVPYMPPRFRLSRAQEEHIRRNRPHAKRAQHITVLLKNYRLSDDVAFRFSDKSWVSHPLSSETYAGWIAESPGHSVNLFMDYETFGEHQWEDTGIFAFLRHLPVALRERGVRCITPSDAIDAWEHNHDVFDAHAPISWADSERDLSAWLGNGIQQSALDAAFALEGAVKKTGDPAILETWRKLLTSDHYYYMSTKYWSDGDVHAYFSPYESPYEAYRRFSHALCDLRTRVTASARHDLRVLSREKKETKHKRVKHRQPRT